jgi:hypothetical protein
LVNRSEEPVLRSAIQSNSSRPHVRSRRRRRCDDACCPHLRPPKQCLSNSTEAPVRVSGEQFRIVSMYSFICQQKQYTQCDVWSCAGSVHFTIVSIARTIHNGRKEGKEGGREREGGREGGRGGDRACAPCSWEPVKKGRTYLALAREGGGRESARAPCPWKPGSAGFRRSARYTVRVLGSNNLSI